jgi:hypothetical protein
MTPPGQRLCVSRAVSSSGTTRLMRRGSPRKAVGTRESVGRAAVAMSVAAHLEDVVHAGATIPSRRMGTTRAASRHPSARRPRASSSTSGYVRPRRISRWSFLRARLPPGLRSSPRAPAWWSPRSLQPMPPADYVDRLRDELRRICQIREDVGSVGRRRAGWHCEPTSSRCRERHATATGLDHGQVGWLSDWLSRRSRADYAGLRGPSRRGGFQPPAA